VLDLLAAATDRFARTVATADPASAVPSCPDWTVRDLVAHLGNEHAWAEQIVRADDPDLDDEDPDGDLAAWYAERADRLCATLAEVDPDRPTWNFVGLDATASFWVRRQLHETTMHTVDLDLARDAAPRVDPAVADDGVLETFEVFGPRMVQRGFGAVLDAPVQVTASDTGTSWTLVPVPEAAPRVVVAGGEPLTVAGAVEGTAQDLLTTLWKRTPISVLALSGDEAVVTRLLESRLTA
jgi:uncharacterized protein (TIGR03083 family)